MHVLDSIHGPDDLKALPAEQLPALAEEIRTFLVELRLQDRRAPRAQPRRGRADDRPAPGVRLPARHDRLRHRSPVLRAQAADRPPRLQPAREAGRPLGLPQPGRVRARRRRELPRLDRAVLGRRHRQGAPPARGGRPAYRRGHRRRRAHRRDGVGGDQQHRHRQGPAAGHRGQRQRPLLRHDDRGDGRPPRHLADHPRLRALPGLGQVRPQGHSRRRRCDVRHPARDEEGAEGHRRAPGHVRGPRPEVPRPGRRSRRAGGGERAHPRPCVRRPGHRPRPHPEGPRLRPGPQRRGRPVPRGRSVQPRDGPAVRGGRPDLDRRVQRRALRDRRRAARTSSPSPRPC